MTTSAGMAATRDEVVSDTLKGLLMMGLADIICIQENTSTYGKGATGSKNFRTRIPIGEEHRCVEQREG